MSLQEMLKQRHEALEKANGIIVKAEAEKRSLTAEEEKLFDAHMACVKTLDPKIQEIRGINTLVCGPRGFFEAKPTGGSVEMSGIPGESLILSPEVGLMKARQFRADFAVWINNTLRAIGGLSPKMEATAPSGPISVSTGTGLDSIGTTVPVEILPYLPTYFNLDSFGVAGAFQFYTDHTRPLNKPVISAGAADSTFAEHTAPTTSQPFGLSGFQFNGTKYSRLVLASYESLMNSELPLQGVILDELLATLATTLTTAFTASMYAALTAASSSLLVAGTDLYQTMIDLRHAVPPRFDLPENKWMLSRATLAKIKNTRASTSGVPMFDPNSNTIFGREFVVNDNFDASIAGLVVYGSWLNGAFLRKTPIVTRVFLELYAQSGQIGYRTTQWADAHFLAELAGAVQPPSFQPLYYAVLA